MPKQTSLFPDDYDDFFRSLKGCDLYLILLEGNGKAVLIQFVPELIPTR